MKNDLPAHKKTALVHWNFLISLHLYILSPHPRRPLMITASL